MACAVKAPFDGLPSDVPIRDYRPLGFPRAGTKERIRGLARPRTRRSRQRQLPKSGAPCRSRSHFQIRRRTGLRDAERAREGGECTHVPIRDILLLLLPISSLMSWTVKCVAEERHHRRLQASCGASVGGHLKCRVLIDASNPASPSVFFASGRSSAIAGRFEIAPPSGTPANEYSVRPE